jgi:lipopolysaccharide transport system ATP-binding protein
MADTVIQASGLGKLYRIGRSARRHDDLRSAIADLATRPFRNFARLRALSGTAHAEEPDTVWALRDATFEVRRGEVVGIIGRNGAGKSTLLRILSRITVPTTGRAVVHGRVGSLLEVGTGFHPELTGRENVFLNGAILGMNRAHIARVFDEIVEFAGVRSFLDTPVKRYSSGMYLRLAFSVAAHLEPEVLIVDEVLAVGDADFQRKCLQKMGDIAAGGRTVLFVSHNMPAVLSLCTRAYLLENGRITTTGAASEVVRGYLDQGSDRPGNDLFLRSDRRGGGQIRLTRVEITTDRGHSAVQCGDGIVVRVGYRGQRPPDRLAVRVAIHDEFGRPVYFLDSDVVGGLPGPFPAEGMVLCRTGPLLLTPGPCTVNLAAYADGELADQIKHATRFEIGPSDFYGTGRLPRRETALCLTDQSWQVEQRDPAEDAAVEFGSARVQ